MERDQTKPNQTNINEEASNATETKNEIETSPAIVRVMKFRTFQGVFTPTVLTILGVIMYIRQPWVVGNAGLIGAIGIVTLASAITLFTALSMSSIVTNIRIQAGGAFSIIAKSLGLEAGGAIGVPLYIAQAIAVAMYIFGFREGWLWIFPTHPALLVDLVTFGLIFAIANISTDFAFKIQYVVLAIIALSLVSIGMGLLKHPINTDIQLFGNYEGSIENNFSGTSFWVVFAVFFPAVTGVMAGANMSGDLEDPRRSIPKGTLVAIGLSYLIYIFVAVVIAFLATPKELLENYNILIDKSFFAPIVLVGLLGATLSSALSSLIGAPRILFALGQNNILFLNHKLSEVDKKGEPKFALYLTAVLVLLSLFLRDLNAIAPLLTMFFLITYTMINVVVLIEQGLGQLSFRPTLRVPFIVPLLGAVGCFFVMFIVNPMVAFISIVLIVAMYIYLTTLKNLETEDGDTRSGIFNSLAEWSAKVVGSLPEASERGWQPNLLVPAQNTNDVVRSYKTIFNLARPKGSVKILGFAQKVGDKKMKKRLPELCNYFVEQGISANSAIVENVDYQTGVLVSMQSLKASFFTPNTLFLSLTDGNDSDNDVATILSKCQKYGFGAYLFVPFRKVGLGLEKTINLWLDIREIDREIKFKVNFINLGLLTAYLLKKNWKAKINLIILINETDNQPKELEAAERYAHRLITLARMPSNVETHYFVGNVSDVVEEVPYADLNILTLVSSDIDMNLIRQQTNSLESSCLYTIDSGSENAFA